MVNAPAIGIDIGTTYSRVAVSQNGRIELILNDLGESITPTCVAFTDVGHLVGSAAQSQAAINPTNTIFDVLRLVGRKFDDPVVQQGMKYWSFNVCNVDSKPKFEVNHKGKTEQFSPESILSLILIKMKETAEAYLRNRVTDAVMIVPTYFNRAQRAAAKVASMMAGLNILRFINGPTATAIIYGLDMKCNTERKVLIFDAGGGALDVGVFTIENGIIEVKTTVCDPNIGGDHFDNCIVNYCVREFKSNHKKNLENNQRAMRLLRTNCERVKRELSSLGQASIEIDSLHDDVTFLTSITRVTFDKANNALFRAAKATIESAIRDAKIDNSDINDVLLVGGSTRIPKILELLKNFFKDKCLIKYSPFGEAVVKGAATFAAFLHGDKSATTQEMLLLDVTPLSLGIATDAGGFKRVVERNTVIPTSKTVTVTTDSDNQSSVVICIFEGEGQTAEENNLLDKLTLTGLHSAPKCVPKIEVTFEIDAGHILKVTAVAKRMRKE